jgi:hypothetical protein
MEKKEKLYAYSEMKEKLGDDFSNKKIVISDQGQEFSARKGFFSVKHIDNNKLDDQVEKIHTENSNAIFQTQEASANKLKDFRITEQSLNTMMQIDNQTDLLWKNAFNKENDCLMNSQKKFEEQTWQQTPLKPESWIQEEKLALQKRKIELQRQEELQQEEELKLREGEFPSRSFIFQDFQPLL